MACEILGSEWTLEVAACRLSTVPQRFIDRTWVAVSAQGRGWKAATREIADVVVTDQRSDRGSYFPAIRAALGHGGAVLLVDDFHVPWLDYATSSHGLLPHALAVSHDDPAGQQMTVIEGHSWWSAAYPLPYSQLLAAGYPEEDPHDISGRYLEFAAPARPPGRAARVRSALSRLHRSCERYTAGSVTTEETAFGTFTVALGEPAIWLATDAYGGLRYVCRLAASRHSLEELGRDVEFGRYTFLRLADDLAFAAYARNATDELLQAGGVSGPCRAAVGQATASWSDAWRLARRLAAEPRTSVLDDLLRALERTIRADIEAATALTCALPSGPG